MEKFKMGAASSSNSSTTSSSSPRRNDEIVAELTEMMSAITRTRLATVRPRRAPPPPPRNPLPSTRSTSAPTTPMASPLSAKDWVEIEEDRDSLDMIQADLRQKYLNEIETVQRQVAGDPESWTGASFDQAASEIERLNRLLKVTDDLALVSQGDGGPSSSKITRSHANDLADEVCCPICFEEMVAPKQILCCSNGHPLCNGCGGKVSECPVCREAFAKNSKPKRNLFAERLIRAYVSQQKT